MRYPGNVVTAEDTRAKGYGSPDKCFYCKGVPGGPHDADCVCIDRPVKIRLTIEMVITAPRSWTQHDIEFYHNDSSHCADNILRDIERHTSDGGAERCMCHRAEVVYIGEATLEEAEAVGLKADTEHE